MHVNIDAACGVLQRFTSITVLDVVIALLDAHQNDLNSASHSEALFKSFAI
jgi:hypothetical protein